jgi:Gpi18-like mannosyltransferase
MAIRAVRELFNFLRGFHFPDVPLWVLFLLGLLPRLALAPFTEHQFDVGTFKNMATLAYSLNINPLYYWSYGPVWLYIILGVYPFYLLISSVYPSELIANLIIKAPLIVGDLALGACLYYFCNRVSSNRKVAKAVAAAWLFNPLVIFVSSVHGMFDVLPALFVLVSLIFLMRRKIELSALFCALAFSTKLYVIFLIPFLLLPVAKESTTKALKFIAVFLGSTFIMYSPYLFDLNALNVLISVYSGYIGFGKFLGFPVGLASFIPYSELPPPVLFVLTNQFFTLLIPALIALMYYLWKKNQLLSYDAEILNRNVAVAVLAYFLAYQFIHVQFVIWVLPSLLIAYSLSRQIRGYMYHAIWASTFLWYLSQGVQTFVSNALLPAASWGQETPTFRALAVTYLSDSVFLAACIICIVSMLRWRQDHQ